MSKIAAWLSVIFIVAGACCFAVAGAMVDWKLYSLDNTVYEDFLYDTFPEEIKEIDINVTSRFVTIVGADEGFKVETSNTEHNKLVVTFENNMLTIREEKKVQIFNINFLTLFHWGKLDVTITLPKTILNNSVIKSTSGGFKITDVSFLGNLTATCTSGRLELKNSQTPELDFTCTSGEVKLNNVTANNIKIKQTSGFTKISNSTVTGLVNAEATSGRIELNKVALHTAKLKVSSGSVYAKIVGVKAEYTLLLSVTSGSAKPANQPGSTNKSITANATSGDITVTFVNA